MEKVVKRVKLSPNKVRDLAIEMCEAIHSIHQKGIVHRDIKPDNFMLSKKTGLIKLIDLLSKV